MRKYLLHSNGTARHYAKTLRTQGTDAERLLWRHLRNRQLGGYKFRRQQPVGIYIADFLCADKCLIVEADGGQHADSAADDAKRTQYLQAGGFRVLRFWNHEVLQETDAVLAAILQALEEGGA